VDAAESGDRVRVAVLREAVEDAPRVEDPVHISFEEEERLYRHYGITFSQENSESLLPVDGPAVPEPSVGEAVAAEPAVAEPSVAESPVVEPAGAEAGLVEPAVTEAAVTEPAVTETAATGPAVTETAVTETAVAETAVPSTGLSDAGGSRGRLLPALAAGAVGVLAVIAAAVFWWRRQHQVPPTRKELLAARARAASLALGARTDQVRTSAAPLLETGRRLSATAAQRAAVEAGAAAERASVQARMAAQHAAALAASARTAGMHRLQRVDSGTDGQSTDEHQRRDAIMSALQAFGGFAAGYTVRARGGGSGRRGQG
jgi:hypothetical protein